MLESNNNQYNSVDVQYIIIIPNINKNNKNHILFKELGKSVDNTLSKIEYFVSAIS